MEEMTNGQFGLGKIPEKLPSLLSPLLMFV
jgi:hypothetical protein